MSSRTRPSHPAVRLHVDLDGDLRPHRSAKIEAHLRVEVAADRAPNDLPAVELAVIIAVDVAEANRAAVRHALPAALRALPDGISFAVLGGGPEPVRFHPRDAGTWAVADRDQRRRAAFAVGSLPLHRDGPRPAGYAPWAAEARALLTDRPLSVPHLVLITDGSSAAGETRLDEELDACAGKFTCDVFAVGADWPPDPLLAIAERLHGTAQFVDEGLGRAVTDAVARLRRAGPAQLEIEVTLRPSVRQVSLTEKTPRPHRLVGLPAADRPHCWTFPTHQWEQGRRDYLLTLVAGADDDPLETDLQFAMVSVDGVHVPVVARWHLPRPSAPPGPTGGGSVRSLDATARMRGALREGLTALQAHRPDTARECLAQAARLAARFGTDWVLDEIRTVADIEDAAEGRIRLRTVAAGTLGPMILRAGSHPGAPVADGAGAPPGPRCGACRNPAGGEARYCIACGKKLL
ncbi:vWA domain-containing protein [Streptomyces sp. NPDC001288]|uniref:vWA domain-containing protein n=1 Tax=Streptomyces sp. NPDC001297 TaxID=3364559 RepID=UPI0036C8DBD3